MAGVDESTKKLILMFLSKWKTTRVSKDRLLDLKDEIIKRSGAKSLPLTTLKKWIKKVVKETKQAEKLKAIALGAPIAAPTTERVFEQSIAYDIAAMKKVTEKALTDISRVKSVANKKPKGFRKKISPQLASIRKALERISSRITEIERRL